MSCFCEKMSTLSHQQSFLFMLHCCTVIRVMINRRGSSLFGLMAKEKRRIKNKVRNPYLGCDSTLIGVLFVVVCPRGVEEEEETGVLDSVDGLPPSDTFSSPPSLFFEPAHHDLILQFYILLIQSIFDIVCVEAYN
jgi:hypothetical protein